MCHSSFRSNDWSRYGSFDGRGTWPTDPERRVGDAERDETITLLNDAAAEGYFTPDELDERVSVALTARTAGDLTGLVQDLPPERRALRSGPGRGLRANAQTKNAIRGEIVTYLRVMAIVLIIWLIVGIAAGAWYFWPIWPALGWGVALVARLGMAVRAPNR